MKLDKSEWPILGVSNIEETINYYVANFLFEKGDYFKDQKTYLRLGNFTLWLTDKHRGPLLSKSKHILEDKKKNTSLSVPSLWIPVEDTASYYKRVTQHTRVLSENKMLDYDFEGFYVLDKEHNKILFFHDHHGPYDSTAWMWSWSDHINVGEKDTI
jgi:hypothetical protein